MTDFTTCIFPTATMGGEPEIANLLSWTHGRSATYIPNGASQSIEFLPMKSRNMDLPEMTTSC
jgi:hypothetical protein